MIIGSSEPVTATHLKIVIDSSDLAGVATVTDIHGLPECAAAGQILTCVFDSVRIDTILGSLPELAVKPLPGVAPGASGVWKATVSADDLAPVTAQAKVEVVEGVDLAAPTDDFSIASTPGGSIPRTLEVDNVGELPADGAVVLFFGDYAFITTKQYSNCTFVDGRPRSCTFDERLAVGQGYMSSEQFPFKLREDTFAPGNQSLEYEWMTKADFALFRKNIAGRGLPDFFGQPGTGGRLSLVPRPEAGLNPAQTDIDPTNSFVRVGVSVEGDNDADFAAIGGSGSGPAGQVVTINPGVKNFGPATRDISRALGFATVDITLPPGSSLTEMPKECFAMKSVGEDGARDPDRGNLATRFIRCENPSTLLIAGTQVTFAVKLRLDQVVVNATGSVAVLTGGCDGCRHDKNPANDTAAVVLNGTLPKTGVQTGLIAGIGALLAFAGIVLLVAGRRVRRTDRGC